MPAISRADRLKRDYVDNRVNAAAAQATDMPEQATDTLGAVNTGLGFLSDAAGVTNGALALDNGIHQGVNDLADPDQYMKDRSEGTGWVNIGAGIVNFGQGIMSMYSHGKKLGKLKHDRDDIKKTESRWGMAAAATRTVGSIFRVASGAMGVAGVTDATQNGFVAGTGAALNTAASVFDTIGARKTANEYNKRSGNTRSLMYGKDKQADYDAYKRNSRNVGLSRDVRDSYKQEAKGVKARMFAMRQAATLNRIKGAAAGDRAGTSGVFGIGAGLLSLGSVLAKNLMGGAAGSAVAGLAGIGASLVSSVGRGVAVSEKKREKDSMDKFHKDIVDEYLNKKTAKIIAQYRADRRAEAAAAASMPQRDDDDSDEESGGRSDGRGTSSSGISVTTTTTTVSSGRHGSAAVSPSQDEESIVPPAAHTGERPRPDAELDELSLQEAQMIALARLGVYNGPIDEDAQFDLSDHYGRAFNAITKKRAKLIMNSKDEEKDRMIQALGLSADASEDEVAAALGYEG